MKTITLILICLSTIFSGFANINYTINEAWKFSLGDNTSNSEALCNDSLWQTVNIPHTWNNMDANDDISGYYRGIGWYRKHVFIGNEANNKCIYLLFEGANQETEVFINGKLVGKHLGGYTRFSFDISSYIKVGGHNLIAIKIDNSHNPSIPPLSADFTFFGGLYRNLSLIIKDKTHISLSDYASDGVYITTPDVKENEAKIKIRTLINNNEAGERKVLVNYTIISPEGKEIKKIKREKILSAQTKNIEFSEEVEIQNPKLWSTELPQLYQLKTEIKEVTSDNVLDSSLNSFGLRWFHFDSQKGFFLNGKSLKLIGTNRHQCFEDMGTAVPDEIQINDIRLIKRMGGNFLRTAHYPQNPLILDLCDKLGIVVSIEIPIVNAITESDDFLKNSLCMAEEMIKQNYNHPSVIIWAYMNEVMLRPPFAHDKNRHQQYCNEVHRQAVKINSQIKSLDPSRYTMIPFHGSMSRYEEADLFSVPEIVGWNLYQGWYGGNFDGFDKFLLEYHQKYPSIPTLITEYGADVDIRLHSFKPERFDFTTEYGDLYHQHYLKSILQYDFIAGSTIWNLNDFYSEQRSDAIPHVNMKGISTLNRNILKNSYLLYSTYLNKTPIALICSKYWQTRGGVDTGNGRCKQPITIYSNIDSVDVYHNNELLKTVYFKNNCAVIDVPFINGINTIYVKKGNQIFDFYTSDFRLIPFDIKETRLEEINVMLGSNRYFEDKKAKQIWIPEQEYKTNSWGYIGGYPARPKTQYGNLPAATINILNTEQDPIFQTQRKGLKSFKFDVKNGKYAIYFYWADLTPIQKDKILAYNLGNDVIYNNSQPNIFNVKINSETVLNDFNIKDQAGAEYGVIKKVVVDVKNNEGITIDFETKEGESFLNAIRLINLF